MANKEERNRKRRERYAERRQAGLTRAQARAPKKAAQVSYDVYKRLSSLADRILKQIKNVPIPTFEEFARNNANKSKAKIIQSFREIGGKIGNQKARNIINRVRNEAREPRREERPISRDLIPISTRRRFNRTGKKRYAYIIKYNVELAEFLEPDTRYATIYSNERLTYEDAVTIFFETMWDIAEHDEKYTVEAIDPDSVVVLYGIDTFKSSQK